MSMYLEKARDSNDDELATRHARLVPKDGMRTASFGCGCRTMTHLCSISTRIPEHHQRRNDASQDTSHLRAVLPEHLKIMHMIVDDARDLRRSLAIAVESKVLA